MSSLLGTGKQSNRRSLRALVLGHLLTMGIVIIVSIALVFVMGIYAKVVWRMFELGWRLI